MKKIIAALSLLLVATSFSAVVFASESGASLIRQTVLSEEAPAPNPEPAPEPPPVPEPK